MREIILYLSMAVICVVLGLIIIGQIQSTAELKRALRVFELDTERRSKKPESEKEDK